MPLDFEKYKKLAAGRNGVLGYDLFISTVKAGNGKQVCFSFYNGVESRITGKSMYMLFTTNNDNSRVYFTTATNRDGYKIVEKSDTRKEMRRVIPLHEYGLWESLCGYYYLRYDKVAGYYYIDKNEKKAEV